MSQTIDEVHYHLDDAAWLKTPQGDPRGYIQAARLAELWLHTGTACNLRCPFCLEGSKPGDRRIEPMTLEEARPFLAEALALGVEQFAFTGGEPFVNKEMSALLAFALELRPCLVLTNGTKPLQQRMAEVEALRARPHPLRFRVSIDTPDRATHDAARGVGNFDRAWETLARLHRLGFGVSVARLARKDEDATAVDAAYRDHFARAGIPVDTAIVPFPDFLSPGAHPSGLPPITENCMTQYHNAESRARFMCAFSRMLVKKEGRVRVYACTLVDDDPDYDLGPTLAGSLAYRVALKHHRCFACFAHGATCSER